MKQTYTMFYDRGVAGRLAGAAAASYRDEEGIREWAEEQGCEGCEIIGDAGTDTRVFVAVRRPSPGGNNPSPGAYAPPSPEGRGEVFVVFRGTADLRNWITDLDCELVNERISESVSGAKIHAGFQQALKSVIPELRETLTRLALERRDVYFTGHSLGGALAMLAAARMQNEEWRMQNENSSRPIPNSPGIWLYTFGQPRVGNAAFAAWYDAHEEPQMDADKRGFDPCPSVSIRGSNLKARSFRIVHAEDIVPRVPWLLNCYRHAGTEIFHDALGAEHVDWPWWRKAPGDVFGTLAEWRAAGRVALLGDHKVGTYVEILKS